MQIIALYCPKGPSNVTKRASGCLQWVKNEPYAQSSVDRLTEAADVDGCYKVLVELHHWRIVALQ